MTLFSFISQIKISSVFGNGSAAHSDKILSQHAIRLKRHQRGFTLVELVVTIIIIGILAVSVLPRFFGSQGFEEYAYQDEVVTKLRAIQQRAMQQTDGTECHQVVIKSDKLGAPDSAACGVNPTINSAEATSTTVIVDASHAVTFSTGKGSDGFIFDSLGRPFVGINNFTIDITISGDENLGVRIESEGYIHAI